MDNLRYILQAALTVMGRWQPASACFQACFGFIEISPLSAFCQFGSKFCRDQRQTSGAVPKGKGKGNAISHFPPSMKMELLRFCNISESHSGEFDFTSYLTMCQVGDGVRPLNLFRTRPRGREEGGREGRGVSAYESGYSAHSTHPIVKLRRATEQLRFFARKTHAGWPPQLSYGSGNKFSEKNRGRMKGRAMIY